MDDLRERFFEKIRAFSATQQEQRLLELVDAEQRRVDILHEMQKVSTNKALTAESRDATCACLRAELERVEAVWKKWFPTIYTDKLLDASAEKEFPWEPHVWD